jgi:hypothetical protein
VLVKAVVGSLRVEPQQIVEQGIVEREQISEQQCLVVVDELLLDGAVEALGVGVHLGGARIGVPVAQALFGQGLGKMAGKFRAVVVEYGMNRQWESGLRQSKELRGGAARMAGGGQGEAEVRVEIGEGNYIATHPVLEALDGIEGDTVAGKGRPERLGLVSPGVAAVLSALALRAQAQRALAQLAGLIGD